MKLGKRALIPSFADTHIHFASYAAFHAGLNVMEAESNEEILEMLGNFAKTCKDKLIIGFGSVDAAMLEPYENSDEKGVLYYTDEQVTEFCKKANRAGMQIEVHAIGDAAFKQATEALKAALEDYPRDDHRHAIIHACLPTKEGIEICEQYGILLPVQSAFIDWPQEPDERLQEILGERSAKLNPFRDYLNHNLILGCGSDGPCTEPDPIMWIHKACNHNVPEQALTVEEALKMCTYNGYYTTFDEKERGSLEVGKAADMVILSENPFAVEKEHLGEIKVERLLLQGRPYKKLHQNPIAQVLTGMFRKTGC
ncbi:MAG: hypothetical protein E7246_02520 [Lachnoclostridium sp.]|nr:hypothetical protein [Lachnoclostridium sp.]